MHWRSKGREVRGGVLATRTQEWSAVDGARSSHIGEGVGDRNGLLLMEHEAVVLGRGWETTCRPGFLGRWWWCFRKTTLGWFVEGGLKPRWDKDDGPEE